MIERLIFCPEPDGGRIRQVREISHTTQENAWIIQQTRGIPSLFENLYWFDIVLELDNPRNIFFLVDSVGLLAVLPRTAASAHVHVTFWDKRLRGREPVARSLARDMFERGYKILWTVVPNPSRTILAFAKRVGFREHRSPLATHRLLALTSEDLRGT